MYWLNWPVFISEFMGTQLRQAKVLDNVYPQGRTVSPDHLQRALGQRDTALFAAVVQSSSSALGISVPIINGRYRPNNRYLPLRIGTEIPSDDEHWMSFALGIVTTGESSVGNGSWPICRLGVAQLKILNQEQQSNIWCGPYRKQCTCIPQTHAHAYTN